MPSNWLAFDRIRAFFNQSGVYRHENILQDQPSLDNLNTSGPERNGLQSAIIQSIQVNYFRRERYKDYDKMDEMGEISLALDMYADESCVVNPETGHIIQVYGTSTRVKNEVQDLFNKTLMLDHQCRSIVRYLCKYGDCAFRLILDKNRAAVVGLKRLDAYNFTRIETSTGDLVAFHYSDPELNQSYFLHPWEVVHFRLTNFEAKFHPYGKAVIEGGRKAFKQLILMESSAVIYRLTRAPQKRKFTIPVGNIPSQQVPEYLRKIAAQFKNKRFYNPSTGQFDERYSPLTQEDDFFLPKRPDGSGPDVDTLQGADNLGQIEDIEYFLKKMIAPTKIPPKRLGIGDKSGGENDGKPLSQTSSDFAKNVTWVQQVMAVGLTKIALVDLALKGFSREEMSSFWISMMVNSAMEELYRIETWQTRVNIMTDLRELGWFPKEWILSHFTDLSPDEIQQMLLKGNADMGDEAAPELGGGGGGGGDLGGGDLFGGGDEGGDLLGGGDEEGGDLFGGDAGGGDEGGDLGGGALLDAISDGEDDPLGESLDYRLNRLEEADKSITSHVKSTKSIDIMNRMINMGKMKRDNSIATAIIESNELLGVPKQNASRKIETLVLEGIDEQAREEKIESFDDVNTEFGEIFTLEAIKEAAESTTRREQLLLDNDRKNSIILLEKLNAAGTITEDDIMEAVGH